jgi:hypothetical protein
MLRSASKNSMKMLGEAITYKKLRNISSETISNVAGVPHSTLNWNPILSVPTSSAAGWKAPWDALDPRKMPCFV